MVHLWCCSNRKLSKPYAAAETLCGLLTSITPKPVLSVANGALCDWDSLRAPQSCSPVLQSAGTQASPAARLRLLPSRAWFTANKLTKLSMKFSSNTKLWAVCRTRMSSVFAAEVSQTELLRSTTVENIRWFFSQCAIGNTFSYLLGEPRHYVGVWQIVYILAQPRELKRNPGKDCRAASVQATLQS